MKYIPHVSGPVLENAAEAFRGRAKWRNGPLLPEGGAASYGKSCDGGFKVKLTEVTGGAESVSCHRLCFHHRHSFKP